MQLKAVILSQHWTDEKDLEYDIITIRKHSILKEIREQQCFLEGYQYLYLLKTECHGRKKPCINFN